MWLQEESCVKYQVNNNSNSMCVDMGIEFSMILKNLLGTFPLILLVLVLGCPCTQENFFMKFSHSKIGHMENSCENAGSILLK